MYLEDYGLAIDNARTVLNKAEIMAVLKFIMERSWLRSSSSTSYPT